MEFDQAEKERLARKHLYYLIKYAKSYSKRFGSAFELLQDEIESEACATVAYALEHPETISLLGRNDASILPYLLIRLRLNIKALFKKTAYYGRKRSKRKPEFFQVGNAKARIFHIQTQTNFDWLDSYLYLVSDLDDLEKKIFDLAFIYDLGKRAIGRELGISRSIVERRYYKAVAKVAYRITVSLK